MNLYPDIDFYNIVEIKHLFKISFTYTLNSDLYIAPAKTIFSVTPMDSTIRPPLPTKRQINHLNYLCVNEEHFQGIFVPDFIKYLVNISCSNSQYSFTFLTNLHRVIVTKFNELTGNYIPSGYHPLFKTFRECIIYCEYCNKTIIKTLENYKNACEQYKLIYEKVKDLTKEITDGQNLYYPIGL